MDEEQKEVADTYIAQLDGAQLFEKPIVTAIEQATAFYPVETYHQDYLTLQSAQPYVVHNAIPKIDSLEQLFPAKFRAEPVLRVQSRKEVSRLTPLWGTSYGPGSSRRRPHARGDPSSVTAE